MHSVGSAVEIRCGSFEKMIIIAWFSQQSGQSRACLWGFSPVINMKDTQWKTCCIIHLSKKTQNKFGCMSQVPCCKDSAKCLRVCEIKANRYIGSSSRSVKLCQWREENHQRQFPVRSTAGGRDLQGLIVHQLEAAEILLFVLWLFFVLRAARLPTQVACIHTTGNLKSTMEKPWDTHTHTQIIDRPQSQPVTPTFSSPSRSHLLQESMEIKD